MMVIDPNKTASGLGIAILHAARAAEVSSAGIVVQLDREPHEWFARGLLRTIDLIDVFSHRLPESLDEGVPGLLGPFQNTRHRAIGFVAHPSREASGNRNPRRAHPKSYALHPAAKDDPLPLHAVRHSYASDGISAL